MLSTGARQKNKNEIIVVVFWPGREKENCGGATEEKTEDMMSKCQMGRIMFEYESRKRPCDSSLK